MPRFPAHTPESAPEASREGLKVIHERFGRALNVQASMAHAPVVLETYLAMKDVLKEGGTFDSRTEQAIALAVSVVNGCDYCQAAHTLGAKAAGMSEEDTIAVRRGTYAGDPELAALLAFVTEAARERGRVSDEVWETARAAGWSDAQLGEALVHVVANVLTNYFNRMVGTDLDLPPAPALD